MFDPEMPDAVDDEGNPYQEIKWEYYFKLGKYHSRWHELTVEDFRCRPDVKKGGEVLVGAFAYTNVPATPGAAVDIETIHDSHGNVLILRAVYDGENWTTIVEEENP